MQCKYLCLLRLLFIWFLIFLLSWVVFYATASPVLLCFNPLNANPTKWSNTFKQFVAKLPKNCLSVFDHFVGLALKGLNGYAATWNTKEEKSYKTFHTFQLSLGPINLVIYVNSSDFKISKQMPLVTV